MAVMCRSRRPGTAIGPDDAVGGQRDLDFVRLEPFVEKLGRALGEDLHQADHFLGPEAAEFRGEF